MTGQNSSSKSQITVGLFMLALVVIYLSDRIINNLNPRLFDWICWSVMVITGITSIVHGIRLNKK